MLALAAFACNGSPVSPTAGATGKQLALTTDRTSYVAAGDDNEGPFRIYRITVVARLTNGLDRTVYLERCFPNTPHPIYGVVSGTGEAEPGYNPMWACVGHNHQIVVLPGATRIDTLILQGPNSWDGHTHEPFGSLEGRFALSYAAGICREVSGCPLSPGPLSNEFEVRLDR